MLTPGKPPSLLTTADVLEAAFPATESGSRVWNAEGRDVTVIPQGAEPRWIILGNADKALPVLRSWNPWNRSSRLRWSAVRFAASINMLRRLPGVLKSNVVIDDSYWRGSLLGFPREWNAVMHVGNASHSRKAIVFFIDRDEQITGAAKIPLVTGALEAIRNEAAMLEHLKHFEHLPRVLYQDRAYGIAVQSWLDGRPVGREFTRCHVDLLSRLAIPNKTARVSENRDEIASQMDAADLPFDRSVLARGFELLDFDAALPCFVEHRDFAPWNLKWMSDGTLGLLDWEWAVPVGLPWQDVCRFFYLDDVHFDGKGKVWETMTSNALLSDYRRHFDIPPEALLPLTMRYLLRVLLMEWEGGNARLANYAFAQIQTLLGATLTAQI